jgi:hypothetical protein
MLREVIKQLSNLNLSNDLNVITAEINSYKQVAGQSIFEIGKRLKYVKENDLAHGEFSKWLEKIEIHPRTAQQMMKIASDKSLDASTYTHLGTRALYEIATMTEEERDQLHTIPSTGETKTVDEMTVRELQEVKKALKESEERAKQEEIEKLYWQKQTQQLKNLPPRVETRTVEVIPESIKKKLDDLKFENTNLRHGFNNYKEKVKQYELRDPGDFDEEQAEKQRRKLQHEAQITTMNMRIAYKNFIEQGAVSSYIQGAIVHASEAEKQHLNEMVEMAEKVIHDTKSALRGRKLGVVNE